MRFAVHSFHRGGMVGRSQGSGGVLSSVQVVETKLVALTRKWKENYFHTSFYDLI
jgi:hypothetical protein